MKVSIIILNYNTFRLTSDCIRSVIRFTKDVDYEIILVDNASTECDPAAFQAAFPSVKLIRNPENNGFAKGNNLGIADSTGDYILLLNSDTVLQEDSVSKSLSCILSQENTGVLGCRMTYPDGRVQYSARRFRSISWELLDLFRFIPYLMSYKKRSRLMLGRYFRHDETITCDWVNGAYFLIPRKVLEQLPGKKLDDRFFMYAEDQFWCEQVRNLGYDVLFFAGTTIIHVNSGSTGLTKQIALRKIMLRNELVIMKQRKGTGIYYALFRLIYITKETCRNILKNLVFGLTGKVMR